MALELLNVRWRSGQHTIGFALFHDNITDKLTARFAYVIGRSIAEDLKFIKVLGLKMSFKEAKAFFPELKGQKHRYKR